ncbi:TIGR00730 family Rossman fold protein [Chloracidobacterium aggregatum]|uniref:LOG family protein n=1 Tax=Chloracidobacterium aggregatum TaxID=2851959 RepID=UPI001FE7A116|nr:TIGR00730 family Rossman fold protein [Chloracidobacterium aggregatum]
MNGSGQLKRVCVYCGSQTGQATAYREVAWSVGERLAQHGIEVVYGGGHVGLMGVVAEAALSAGGRVIGVIPERLLEREVAYREVTEMYVTRTMHERKARMMELSDAFVALPGGIGTLDELFEIWTWRQLGYHSKPVGLLNVAGYYDGLLGFLDRAVQEGFLTPDCRDLLMVETDFGKLLARLSVTIIR